MENSRHQAGPCLDSLQGFDDGFRAPHKDLFYGCTKPRILPARLFIIPETDEGEGLEDR